MCVHAVKCFGGKKVVIDSLANNVMTMQHYKNYRYPDSKVSTSQSDISRDSKASTSHGNMLEVLI